MNYNTNQSIFIQIADRICDRVLSGEYQAEARIPSVRELALEMKGSNPPMRAPVPPNIRPKPMSQ